MLRATEIVKNPAGPFADEVVLDYEGRHRRRLMLCGVSGTEFLLDLADIPDLQDGDGIALSSETLVRVRAAEEPLMEVRCRDMVLLARIAWHVGNRHLPSEIGRGTLRLRADHVIADMIEGLGGDIRYLSAPFNPEGGAYGRRGAATSDAHHHGGLHE